MSKPHAQLKHRVKNQEEEREIGFSEKRATYSAISYSEYILCRTTVANLATVRESEITAGQKTVVRSDSDSEIREFIYTMQLHDQWLNNNIFSQPPSITTVHQGMCSNVACISNRAYKNDLHC